MQHRVSLEKQQREMVERIAAKRKRRKQVRKKKRLAKICLPPPAKPRWIETHFLEVMERLIDDLGLDVPRREHKQPTA